MAGYLGLVTSLLSVSPLSLSFLGLELFLPPVPGWAPVSVLLLVADTPLTALTLLE